LTTPYFRKVKDRIEKLELSRSNWNVNDRHTVSPLQDLNQNNQEMTAHPSPGIISSKSRNRPMFLFREELPNKGIGRLEPFERLEPDFPGGVKCQMKMRPRAAPHDFDI